MGRVCTARGCFNELTEKRPDARFCSDRCRNRHHYWTVRRPLRMVERDCCYCGRPMGFVGVRKRYCSQRCATRAWRDTPLSVEETPYWREYLRRFDVALRERTPENWRAFRELSPPSENRGRPYNSDLAALIRSLEV